MSLHWKSAAAAPSLDPRSAFRLKLTSQSETDAASTAWWSLIVVLDGTSLDSLAQSTAQHLGSTVGEALHIPSDYTQDERRQVAEYWPFTLYARHDAAEALNEQGAAWGVTAFHLGHRARRSNLDLDAGPVTDAWPRVTLPPNGVVTAVIDDGIAFAHEVFREDLVTTRTAHVSLLEADIVQSSAGTGADGAETEGGVDAPRVSVGRALGARQINAMLKACTSAGLLDEARFYREAGLVDFARSAFSPASQRTSHGTHVMSVASGFPMGETKGSRPILCAVLPTTVTEDTTGQSLAPSLNLALKRLTRQAARYVHPSGAPAPVVFNFSYGTFGGPHDGTDIISQVIATYFDADTATTDGQQCRLVLPAGNGNLARIHAEVRAARRDEENRTERQSTALDMLVLPDDRTASYMQLWMPFSPLPVPPGFASVTVTAPGGAVSSALTAPDEPGAPPVQHLVTHDGHVVATLGWYLAPYPTLRAYVELKIAPTASLRPTACAPSGMWRIEVTPLSLLGDQVIHGFIERDATLRGFRPGGRQPYFANACYQKFDAEGAPLAVDPPKSDCPIKRAGTLSGYACGTAPLVVTAQTHQNGLLSDYASAGPITPQRGNAHPDRSGPDASARGDDSPVLPGVLGAGSSSGSFTRQSGTSMAAPRVARLAAEHMSGGGSADRMWLRTTAAQMDSAFTPPKPRETRVGGGRMTIPVVLQLWPAS